jgi:hypothetical protein
VTSRLGTGKPLTFFYSVGAGDRWWRGHCFTCDEGKYKVRESEGKGEGWLSYGDGWLS